jgi:hypothetical protein
MDNVRKQQNKTNSVANCTNRTTAAYRRNIIFVINYIVTVKLFSYVFELAVVKLREEK